MVLSMFCMYSTNSPYRFIGVTTHSCQVSTLPAVSQHWALSCQDRLGGKVHRQPNCDRGQRPLIRSSPAAPGHHTARVIGPSSHTPPGPAGSRGVPESDDRTSPSPPPGGGPGRSGWPQCCPRITFTEILNSARKASRVTRPAAPGGPPGATVPLRLSGLALPGPGPGRSHPGGGHRIGNDVSRGKGS
eukprot:758352-Hanusia_phi.AAC.3